jgi:hypothetical protein
MVVRVSRFYQSFTCFILSFIHSTLNMLRKPTLVWGGWFDKSDGFCSYCIMSNIRCIIAILACKFNSGSNNFISHFLIGFFSFRIQKRVYFFSCARIMLFDSFNNEITGTITLAIKIRKISCVLTWLYA